MPGIPRVSEATKTTMQRAGSPKGPSLLPFTIPSALPLSRLRERRDYEEAARTNPRRKIR